MSVQRFFVSRSVSNIGERILGQFYGLGGSVVESGGYKIHTFTSSSNISFSKSGTIDFLIVAGGGGAGYDVGGGGGGGGLIYLSSQTIDQGTHLITVGTGGQSGQTTYTRGSNGNDSYFNTHTAVGGGGGGAYSQNSTGLDGGSGGGGGGSAGAAGGSGTGGQGNNGGRGATSAHGSGGGGGAGGAGAAGIANTVVSGGSPTQTSISGTNQYYSGGGFGNSDGGTLRPTGQNTSGSYLGTYGFGANGTGSPNNSSYSGNDGVVIIRYLI